MTKTNIALLILLAPDDGQLSFTTPITEAYTVYVRPQNTNIIDDPQGRSGLEKHDSNKCDLCIMYVDSIGMCHQVVTALRLNNCCCPHASYYDISHSIPNTLLLDSVHHILV